MLRKRGLEFRSFVIYKCMLAVGEQGRAMVSFKPTLVKCFMDYVGFA